MIQCNAYRNNKKNQDKNQADHFQPRSSSHSYFCVWNGLAEVEENDSNDTPVLWTHGYFFWKNIGLNNITESNSKDMKVVH